jgi:hypothetical protein
MYGGCSFRLLTSKLFSRAVWILGIWLGSKQSSTSLEPADSKGRRPLEAGSSKDALATDIVCKSHYEDLAYDTDEDWSRIPEDYGRSNST